MDHAMSLVTLLLLVVVMATVNAQYVSQYSQQQQPAQYVPKPEQQYAAILSHRQGQSSDGAVNFNFATDHGLQQGETINPDGSRSGSYSYLDPNGKKISVKYSAGKEGFKILEGAHIPKPVAPLVAPQPQVAPAPAAFPRYSSEGGQYQGSRSYGRQTPALFNNVQQDLGQYRASQPSPYYSAQQDLGQHRASSPSKYYSVQEDQDSGRYFAAPQTSQYTETDNYDGAEDAGPKKPHNFGQGYSFEFTG